MKTHIYIVAIVLFFLVSCKDQKQHQKREMAMESYEQLLSDNFNSFIEHAWNNANMDSLRMVLDDNYVKSLNGIQVAGNLSEMEANMKIYFKGFPDGEVVVEHAQINKDHLHFKWRYAGTNTGIFGEFPPTGKKISVNGYANLQFNELGKIISEEVYFNELELLQQLGYTLNPPIVE